jgi:hypothetical protein
MHTIPAPVEAQWNTLTGDIICQDCGQTIDTDVWDGYPYTQAVIDAHLCPYWLKGYTFDNPLSIQDYIKQAKAHAYANGYTPAPIRRHKHKLFNA